jgi:hypothetical protein
MGFKPCLLLRPLLRSVSLGLSGLLLISCSLFESTKKNSGGKLGAGGGVLGASLGDSAYGEDSAGLETVYGVTTPHAPAAVRPDPDLIVRNLLLQYRESGSTVAREIGRVEEFRLLLGGANVTFTVTPQESYDSTSILAEMKVAGEICGSLINPSENEHPGWATILPADPASIDANLAFLAQRLLGVPTSRIDAAAIASLKTIVQSATDEGRLTAESYIPACISLILDAEGLLL